MPSYVDPGMLTNIEKWQNKESRDWGLAESRTRGYVTNVAESMFYNKKEKNMPPSNGLYNMKTLGMDFRTSWKVVVAYEKFVNKDGTNDILWVAL